MILLIIVAAVLSFWLFTMKKPARRQWLTLFLFGLVLAFVVSLVSVWSVWTPWIPRGSLPNGYYSGASALSYPLWMQVYIGPESQGIIIVRNISFDVFFSNAKILEATGMLKYAPLLGNSLTYQLKFSFFTDGPSFFGFLLLLFTVFNTSGFALGVVLSYFVSRMLRTRKDTTTNDR